MTLEEIIQNLKTGEEFHTEEGELLGYFEELKSYRDKSEIENAKAEVKSKLLILEKEVLFLQNKINSMNDYINECSTIEEINMIDDKFDIEDGLEIIRLFPTN